MSRPGMYVYLTPADVAEAQDVARMRQQNAIDERRVNANNLEADEEMGFALQMQGCFGEKAGHIAFSHELDIPIVWHKFKTGDLRGLADLGNFIDTKTVPKHLVSYLIVKQGGIVPQWAYVLISNTDHPHYRLIGWCWGKVLMHEPLSCPKPNRPAHVIKEGDSRLRDCRELQTIVKERKMK